MSTQSRKRRAQSDIRGPDAASPPQRRRTGQAAASSSMQVNRRRQVNNESFRQGARRENRRVRDEEDEVEVVEETEEGETQDKEMDADLQDSHSEMHKDRLIKNLVRLALSNELQRQPIRRQDISSKVLGSKGRQFKEIFSLAQTEFKHVFGMEMTELPMRDKTKLTQRRVAVQASDKGLISSNSYILTSVLPPAFRAPEILEPYGFKDQAYAGLVTFITSLIYLNGRSLAANRLTRSLRRVNADEFTPLDRTEKLLQTMQKHGYIIRIKDNTGDETSYDYHLGPRAKVEIGEEGVKGLIRTVYGESAPEDLDVRFKRNVGVELKANFEEDRDAAVGIDGQGRKKKAPPRVTRRRNDGGSGDE